MALVYNIVTKRTVQIGKLYKLIGNRAAAEYNSSESVQYSTVQ